MFTKNTICTNDVLQNNTYIKDKFHLVRYVCKRVKELNVGIESRLNYILKFKSNIEIAIQEIYFNLYPDQINNNYNNINIENNFKMQSNQVFNKNNINYFLEEAQFLDREAELELESQLNANIDEEIENLINKNDLNEIESDLNLSTDLNSDLDEDLESDIEQNNK
ncbi:MAG: hypothetical protein U1E31_01170 [Rickettsiales bacterium]